LITFPHTVDVNVRPERMNQVPAMCHQLKSKTWNSNPRSHWERTFTCNSNSHFHVSLWSTTRYSHKKKHQHSTHKHQSTSI